VQLEWLQNIRTTMELNQEDNSNITIPINDGTHEKYKKKVYMTLEFFNDVRAVINVSNLSLVTLVREIKKRKMSMFFFKILPHSHCFSISSFLEISTSCYFLLFSHQISSSNFDTSLWSATLDLINFLTQHFFLQTSWTVASCQRFRTILFFITEVSTV